MGLVQNEVRKVSTAVLDPDFSKMQSIVVSDPNDPHLLLVVINVAALSRKNMELVKLIPVPYYEGMETFLPMLDYNTIVLDQLAATYSILEEQEEFDCLSNRCYVSNVEQSITEKSCGIPQLFDRQLDVCLSESISSNGVFLKPMLPDGVIFAFRSEVNTQLFCKDNNLIGSPRKLNGTGILQLPNGCILSVTDDQGRNTKVKGQPLYRMIDADDIDLVINGPLSALRALSSRNGTHKLSTYGAFLTEHLSSVVKQVENADQKITNQSNHIWALTGTLSVILTLTILVFLILYRFSGKFRNKIQDLRDKMAELTQQLLNIEINQPGPTRGPLPPVPPRPVELLISRFRAKRTQIPKVDPQDAEYMSLEDLSTERRREMRMYQPPSTFRPVNSKWSPKVYPRLTPMLRQLSELELSELQKESEEVESLCKSKDKAKSFEPLV
jgi:hypothetical protein